MCAFEKDFSPDAFLSMHVFELWYNVDFQISNVFLFLFFCWPGAFFQPHLHGLFSPVYHCSLLILFSIYLLWPGEPG